MRGMQQPAGSMVRGMDAELGRRYQALALRLDRRRPGVVRAFAGPPALAEAIAGEAQPPFAELHDEALAIADQAAEPTLTLADDRRAAWRTGQAMALATIARVLRGDEIALPDRIETLTWLEAARMPEPEIAGVHRQLDAALPGGSALRARMAHHRAATTIPPELVPTALERLLAVLRDRARADLDLPSGEAVTVDPVAETSETWHARAAFEPPGRTRLSINLAVPWHLDELVRVAAGEGYPGHHAAHADRTAAADGEQTLLVWLGYGPDATVLTGIAAMGREVLLGDFELAGDLRMIGRDLGLRWDVEQELEVARAREKLGGAVANAVLQLHHDGLPEAEVRGYLAESVLIEADVVDRLVRRITDPLDRVVPFVSAAAPALVRDWLATTGQTDGLRRLLREPHTPAQLRAEAGVLA